MKIQRVDPTWGQWEELVASSEYKDLVKKMNPKVWLDHLQVLFLTEERDHYEELQASDTAQRATFGECIHWSPSDAQ